MARQLVLIKKRLLDFHSWIANIDYYEFFHKEINWCGIFKHLFHKKDSMDSHWEGTFTGNVEGTVPVIGFDSSTIPLNYSDLRTSFPVVMSATTIIPARTYGGYPAGISHEAYRTFPTVVAPIAEVSKDIIKEEIIYEEEE